MFSYDRVNLALDSMVLQVYQEYPEVKEYLDQREILVSLVALDHQDDLDLMVAQDLKVFCCSVTVFYSMGYSSYSFVSCPPKTPSTRLMVH